MLFRSNKRHAKKRKVGYKVRALTLLRVPFILVVGEREREEKTVAVRNLKGENLGAIPLDAWLAEMQRMQQEYK